MLSTMERHTTPSISWSRQCSCSSLHPSWSACIAIASLYRTEDHLCCIILRSVVVVVSVVWEDTALCLLQMKTRMMMRRIVIDHPRWWNRRISRAIYHRPHLITEDTTSEVITNEQAFKESIPLELESKPTHNYLCHLLSFNLASWHIPLFVASWYHYSLHHDSTIRCIMRLLFVALLWKQWSHDSGSDYTLPLSLINYLNVLESKMMYLLIVMSHDNKWKIFWLQ